VAGRGDLSDLSALLPGHNGDGIGDLKGITQRLDHIASLGVDAVWISPFFTSPMKDFGYDVSDYRDVDPMFGTLADFDALIAARARTQGRVMIDLVLSHTSDQHPWFRKAAKSRDQSQGRLVCLGRTQARWHAAEQLAVGLWRHGLAMGPQAPAILPAQLPDLAARPELPQPDVQDALLDVARSGWIAASTASASTRSTSISTTSFCATIRPCRRTTATIPSRPRSIPTTGRNISIPRTAPKTSTSCAACAR
jgi:hypothetical protein